MVQPIKWEVLMRFSSIVPMRSRYKDSTKLQDGALEGSRG